MKRGEPFNVLRDRNSWSNVPRAEAVAFQILAVTGITATQTAIAVATTVASLALSVATSAIISALTPVPPTPKQSLLVNARDAAGPQEFVYGETRKGGTITYLETTRGGSVLYQVIALAAHEIESVEEIYINDEVAVLSNDAYSNSRRSGAGWVTNRNWSDDSDEHEIRIFYHLGDQTAITDTFANSSVETLDSVFFDTGSSDEDSQNFGGVGQPTKASFVGNGIAYLFVRFGYASGVFQNGIPVITAKIRGKKVFDPRTSTTAYSNNAALCIRDFLTSPYGLNDPEVDDTVFQAAANTCDEAVTLDAGGTESRYTMNGVVRADQSYGDVLQEMVKSCAGTLFWGAGKWKLQPGEYNAPTKTFTLDDLRSEISLQTRVNLRDQFNRVQGVFSDANQRYIAADYPPIESATFKTQDGGVEQTLDLDLPFTTSAATAQRLAKMTLFRGREQMTFSAEFSLNAFDVEVGEIVALTIDRYGWTAKEFEVVGWRFGANQDAGDLRVTLTLRETSSAAFDWDAEESDISGNDTDLTGDLEAVTNLTASDASVVQKDGTYINVIKVDWDGAAGANGYRVEWMVNTTADYTSNGGRFTEADITTAREQLVYDAFTEILFREPGVNGMAYYATGGGSTLTEDELRQELRNSPERDSLTFSGLAVENPTTEYSITPVLDDTIYFIRVRAFNERLVSQWRSVTFDSGNDDSLPDVPTSVSATGGFKYITVEWTNPVDLDFAYVEIWESDTNDSSAATLIGTSSGNSFVRTNLGILETKWYFLKAVDYTGNTSAFTVGVSGETTGLSDPDFENGIRTLFEEQGLFPIEDVTDLLTPGTTVGQKAFNRTDGKLYEWNGTSWAAVVPNITAGSITQTEIANNSISTGKLQANAVEGDKIAGNTITGSKIVANTITGGLLATSGIITNTAQIGNGLITNAKIGNAEVDTLKIKDEAVIVPYSETSTTDISGTGDNSSNWKSVRTVLFTLPVSAKLTVIWSGANVYTGAGGHGYQLAIDTTPSGFINPKQFRGGADSDGVPTLAYSQTYPAGTYYIKIRWRADSTVTLDNWTIIILGAMR